MQFLQLSVPSSSITFEQSQQFHPNVRHPKVSQLIQPLPLLLKLTAKQQQDCSTNHGPRVDILKCLYEFIALKRGTAFLTQLVGCCESIFVPSTIQELVNIQESLHGSYEKLPKLMKKSYERSLTLPLKLILLFHFNVYRALDSNLILFQYSWFAISAYSVHICAAKLKEELQHVLPQLGLFYFNLASVDIGSRGAMIYQA